MAKTKKKKKTVYFIDGFSPKKGLLGILAYPHSLKGSDVEFTRFYMTRDSAWVNQEFKFDSRSVSYMPHGKKGAWWVLGKRGEVAEVSDNGIRTENIVDVGSESGKYGYANKLIEISGELYVCGFQRQVYRRDGGKWTHMDAGILSQSRKPTTSLESMDGTSADNIYAVGAKGEIFHFNGKSWTHCHSPTNVDLHEVRCAAPDLVYACGEEGVVLKGNARRWEIVPNDELDAELWGVEILDDQVYVAGFGGLGKIDGGVVVKIDPGLGRDVDGYRLRQNGGLLWSIGTDDILCYDGRKWTELVCPDNA
jgi:hypothetical protein